MQLRKEAWKIQDFNGVWTRDLVITGVMLYQLSYEATDVGSRSIVGSYVPVKEMSVNDIWNKSYIKLWKWNENEEMIIAVNAIYALHKLHSLWRSWRNDHRSERNLCNCVHYDDHFFIFISFPQFICDLFHISLTIIILSNWPVFVDRIITSITIFLLPFSNC